MGPLTAAHGWNQNVCWGIPVVAIFKDYQFTSKCKWLLMKYHLKKISLVHVMHCSFKKWRLLFLSYLWCKIQRWSLKKWKIITRQHLYQGILVHHLELELVSYKIELQGVTFYILFNQFISKVLILVPCESFLFMIRGGFLESRHRSHDLSTFHHTLVI